MNKKYIYEVIVEQVFGNKKYRFTERKISDECIFKFLSIEMKRWQMQEFQGYACKSVKVISCIRQTEIKLGEIDWIEVTNEKN